MSKIITIEVNGRPAPAGSRNYYGKGRSAPASKYQKPWQEAVAIAAILAKPDVPLEGPIHLVVHFVISRPKSHYLKSYGLKKSAPTIPPIDFDKLIRSTADALTGPIYKDDKQIVKIEAEKCYSSLVTGAGAIIRIEEID